MVGGKYVLLNKFVLNKCGYTGMQYKMSLLQKFTI